MYVCVCVRERKRERESGGIIKDDEREKEERLCRGKKNKTK